MHSPPDPIALTQALVRRPSVTPEEGGALTLLEETLRPFGFRCERVDRNGIANLYARWGEASPVFAFGGHTDVVPVGDAAAWAKPPFGGEIQDGRLWGRGATDMKSGVAAFVAAACGVVAESPPDGSIALLITGDEEGDALDGTTALLDHLRARGEALDVCLVGEPTSVSELGDTAKIGRRGSLNAQVVVEGVQGHAAYPHRAKNPLPALVRFLDRIAQAELDKGGDHFEPSTLALTSVDVGNAASNVIPAAGRAAFNIRFNDQHSAAGLTAWLEVQAAEAAAAEGVSIHVTTRSSGEAFLTAPGPLSDLVSDAVVAETGRRPVLTTGGGTSDARYIKDMCPVIEFGLVGATMHQVDECAAVEEIAGLSRIYARILRGFFEARA